MRELPGQLTKAELEELFSGPSTLVSILAETPDPLGSAEEITAGLSDEDKIEALAGHARIGEPSPEQHGGNPAILTELAYLNQVYEEKFGFRFVVFVAGRSRAAWPRPRRSRRWRRIRASASRRESSAAPSPRCSRSWRT